MSNIDTIGADFPDDGLNAEDKAAKAEALCVCPPEFPLDLSWLSNGIENQSHHSKKEGWCGGKGILKILQMVSHRQINVINEIRFTPFYSQLKYP